MDLKTQLRELLGQHAIDLAAYPWVSEADRWAELVYCLLNQCSDQDPDTTRAAVTDLQRLQLLNVGELALLEKRSDENAVVLAYTLKQHEFSEEDAQRAVGLLIQVARVIHRDHSAKIQRYLRRHGEAMRDELTAAFTSDFLTEAQLRYAVSHWLQNALSLPISLEHPAVLDFCEENQTSLEDLWQAADELDLNLAVVDDVLEMEKKAREAMVEEQTTKEKGS